VGLHPFRLKINPGNVGGKCVKFDSRDLALTAVFGALYVVINVIQSVSVGNPTIYGPVQLRVADCLIALAALFGLPVIGGVTLGCFVSNFVYFLGAQDVLFGSLANLIAASVVFLLRKHRFVACFAGALPIGLIVGAYLPIFFQFSGPEVFGFLPPVGAMIVSITISSFITVGILGYLLLLALSRPSVLGPLKSHGLKTVI
jgi:uncharacterized membrane protein